MNPISREEFYQNIAENYFEDRELTLEKLKQTIQVVMPIFGELQVDVNDEENGDKTIIFTDIDRADAVCAPKEAILTEADLDMSCRVLKLSTKNDGCIWAIEHGLYVLTRANKDIILLLGSLAGKKVLL